MPRPLYSKKLSPGRKEIIDLLRQRSRPYLFSNSLAPGIIGASLEVFKMLKESDCYDGRQYYCKHFTTYSESDGWE